MELVIGLAVVAGLVYFFFFRDKKEVKEALSPAPYKVETPEQTVVEPQPPMVEPAPAPIVTAAPAPVDKPKAKKAATKPKAEKAVKAAPKAKAAGTKAKKPKMTVAK